MKPVANAGNSVDSPPPVRVDDPTLIAHRGFAGAYPENTHAAMREATAPTKRPAESAQSTRSVADAVEIDVVPCASGELVVFHDAFLDRLTDAPVDAANRTIWETPLDRLRELEILDSGETVPLLVELLETIPERVPVTVELKNPGTTPARTYRDLPDTRRASYDRAWEASAESFVEVIDGFGHDFLVTSSFEGALRAMNDVAPEIPLGYFFGKSIETGIEVTRRYDAEVCCPPRTAIPGTSFFNDAYDDLPDGGFEQCDLVSIAHAEGRAVYAWTIDTRRQAAELRATGVDGLLSDYPGLLGPDDRTVSSTAKPADD